MINVRIVSYLVLASLVSSCRDVGNGEDAPISTEITTNAVPENSQISGTSSIVADGVSTSVITISLRDSKNVPIVNVVPSFSATDSGSDNIYGSCSSTDSNGISVCSLASTKAEAKTLSITSPVIKSGGAVTFVAGPVSSSKSTITGTGAVLADGSETSDITITLLDAFENPVAGQVPTFEATDWENTNIYGACSATDSNGESRCTLASSEGETKVLSIKTPVVKTGGSVVFTEIDYCVGAALTNAPFAFGDGTVATPYGICTAAQLNSIAANATYITKHFKLFKNIDLSSYTANSFNRIASSAAPFTGTFNGNRKIISNLTYSDSTATGDYTGLFRSIGATGTVKNLGLTGFNITGRNYTGMLAGFLSGNVNNCYAKGVVRGAQNTGGLIGRFWKTDNTTIVQKSYTEANVTGSGWVGGLIGWARGTVTDSHSISTVSTTVATVDRVGGLVGVVDSGDIVNSYAEATVTGRWLVGGLVGGMLGSITKSHVRGTVNCTQWCGGVAGTFQTVASGKITKSYADVTINGTGGQFGGILGYGYASSHVENCWAKVTINSTAQWLGPIAGYTLGNVTNSYGLPVMIGGSALERGGLVGETTLFPIGSFWDKDLPTTSLVETVGKNVSTVGAKTTAEMKTAQTYIDAGWDTTVWNIQDGSYPTLK